MNWRAAFITLGLAVVAGAFLYLPFFLWFRWRSKTSRKPSAFDVRFTRAGYFLLALTLLSLFAGLGAGTLAPQSWFGSQVRTLFGALGYLFVVLCGYSGLEWILRKQGVVFAYRMATPESEESAVDPVAAISSTEG